MSKSVFYILGIVLLAAPSAFGARILEVEGDGKGAKISQSEDSRAFVKDDYLCVTHAQIEVACGIVKEAENDYATIRFDFVKEPLNKDDRVVYAGGRYPASSTPPTLEGHVTVFRRAKRFPFDITLGAMGGLNYFMPMAHFQGMVSTRTALGVMPVFFRRPFATPTLSAVGGFFTVNYYTQGYFRGFWLGAGAGFYSFSAIGSRPVTSGAALAQVGYRVGLFKKFNLGVALGGQYINRPQTGTDTLAFAELQGIGTFDLGWNF